MDKNKQELSKLISTLKEKQERGVNDGQNINTFDRKSSRTIS